MAATSALADACADVPLAQGSENCWSEPATAAGHTGHSGYVCTATTSNESCEDYDDVRTVDKKWNDESEVNCGCPDAQTSFTLTKNHVNTNSANIGGGLSGSVSATVGGSLAGLAKAEATATASWTVSAGWGNEVTDTEGFILGSQFTLTKCQKGWYNKWYWVGTVNGTADLRREWQDDHECPVGIHHGSDFDANIVTAYGHGVQTYNGEYSPHGQGWQPEDYRCSCDHSTPCYKWECPGDCGSCEE